MGEAQRKDDTLEAKVMKRTGRYELATKVEVNAFVGERMKRLADAVQGEIDELSAKGNEIHAWAFDQAQSIIDLRGRIAELELTNWQRVKRALADWIEKMRQPVPDRLYAEIASEAPQLIDLDEPDLERQSVEIAQAIRAIDAYDEVPPIPIEELGYSEPSKFNIGASVEVPLDQLLTNTAQPLETLGDPEE